MPLVKLQLHFNSLLASGFRSPSSSIYRISFADITLKHN